MREINHIGSEMADGVDAMTAEVATEEIGLSLDEEYVANVNSASKKLDIADDIDGMRRCKNCGSMCNSAYCGACGQSMSVERLNPRQFFMDLLSGLLRINRGFIFTARHLLLHPWKVIRDYIQGRRIVYTPPVNMLVLLCFIGTIITGLFIPERNGNISSFEMPADSSLIYRIGVSIGDFFANSTIAQNLTIYLPTLLAIPLVYRNHGSKKYNIAEYFVAMIYMVCSFMIFRILISPLYTLFPDSDWSVVNLIYIICISGASLYMAFPMSTKKARVKHFIYYLLFVFAIYLIFAIFLGIGLTWILE